MAAPNPSPSYVTTCKLCGVRLTHQPIPAEGVPMFVMKLYNHMSKSHPEESEKLRIKIQDFAGLATSAHFEITDPMLVSLREEIRQAFYSAFKA